MPDTLTDADIAKHEAGGSLSDSDIASHDSRATPDPGYFGTLWNDLKSLPGGAYQLLRHPLDTAKAAAGEMNLQDPSKSSGILGLPDELAKEWEAGHHREVLARITELGLPIIFKGAGLAAEGAASAAGKAVDVATSPAARDIAGIVSPRAAHMLSVGSRLRKAAQAFQDSTVAPEATAAAPAEDMTMLDGLAQSQTGKRFSKLGAADQKTIRELAQKIQQPAQAPPAAPLPAKAIQSAPVSAIQGKTIAQLAQEELAPKAAPAPEAAPAPANPQGSYLRNYDLDKIARTLRSELNKGTITKDQATTIISSPAGIESLRQQLGIPRGAFAPSMADYLKGKVF